MLKKLTTKKITDVCEVCKTENDHNWDSVFIGRSNAQPYSKGFGANGFIVFGLVSGVKLEILDPAKVAVVSSIAVAGKTVSYTCKHDGTKITSLVKDLKKDLAAHAMAKSLVATINMTDGTEAITALPLTTLVYSSGPSSFMYNKNVMQLPKCPVCGSKTTYQRSFEVIDSTTSYYNRVAAINFLGSELKKLDKMHPHCKSELSSEIDPPTILSVYPAGDGSI